MAHVSCSDGFNGEEMPPTHSQEHPVLDFAAGIAMEEKEEEEKKKEHQVEEVELKKKRLLEEVESKEELFCGVGPSSLGLGLGIGIKVIDETALLETVPSSVGIQKKSNKQSRRRAAGKKSSVSVSVNVNLSSPKYTRKEMEALRFVNVSQQRKFWKSIYARLQSSVAKEYDTLATTTHHNHHNPPQCLPNNNPAPPILSVGAANGRWRYMNVFVH